MGGKATQRGASRQQRAEPRRPRFKLSLWINRLLILAGAAVVGTVGVEAWLYVSGQPVQHIRVTGDLENLQRERVQELIQPALAGGFLNTDLGRIRRDLESLPWVYQVSVRRRWPDALEIEVAEQRPIARWGEEGFLNHKGQVFHTSREGDWDELPLLRGPGGSTRDLMAQYLRLLALLRPLDLELRELALDERGQLRATTTGGMELVLGNSEFIERVQRFVAIYPQHLQPRLQDIERVDLRYASGLAVAFREEQVDEAASQLAGL